MDSGYANYVESRQGRKNAELYSTQPGKHMNKINRTSRLLFYKHYEIKNEQRFTVVVLTMRCRSKCKQVFEKRIMSCRFWKKRSVEHMLFFSPSTPFLMLIWLLVFTPSNCRVSVRLCWWGFNTLLTTYVSWRSRQLATFKHRDTPSSLPYLDIDDTIHYCKWKSNFKIWYRVLKGTYCFFFNHKMCPLIFFLTMIF